MRGGEGSKPVDVGFGFGEVLNVGSKSRPPLANLSRQQVTPTTSQLVPGSLFLVLDLLFSLSRARFLTFLICIFPHPKTLLVSRLVLTEK